MYLLSLYFQDPATLDFSPLAGRARDPARHGRPGRGRAVRAPARQASSAGVRPSARASSSPPPGFVVIGFTARVVGVRRVPAPAGRHRGRHGPVERTVVVRRHGLRRREAGRRGVRGLQHGAVRRRRGRDGTGRHDLRHRDRQPERGRRQSASDALSAGPRGRVVGDDRDQRPRHPARRRRHPAAPRRQRHPAGRCRLRRRAPAHAADHCVASIRTSCRRESP